VATNGVPLLSLVGCASPLLRSLQSDGIHCFITNRGRRRTCTPDPVPEIAVDEEAKRLASDPSTLTVYVVRGRWWDAGNVVMVRVRDQTIGTVPHSFIRARLTPGTHRIEFAWAGDWVGVDVHGAVGEIRFIELVGSTSAWGNSYRWWTQDEQRARALLGGCRLVRDVFATGGPIDRS
jgi:hypothetical protein